MKVPRYLASTVAFSLLLAAGCGGGGGDDGNSSAAPPPGNGSGEVPTYGNTNLPGRLLVQATTGPSTVYDLRTGQGTKLPMGLTDRNSWTGSTNPEQVLRMSNGGPNGSKIVERIRTSDWAVAGNAINLPGSFGRPKVSPDGRYILDFWNADGDPEETRLTIFSTETGQIVKQGSQLDGKIVANSPAAWLPDGRYLYLAGRHLYESSPSANTSTLRAVLTGLPDNSFSGNPVDASSGGTQMSVSPDGQKIAFSWTARRDGHPSDDTNVWVAQVDGTNLHRMTSPTDPASALAYTYGNATWSPDSKWVAAVLYMGGVTVAPIFPPDQSFPGVPGGIIGATGCGLNPAFVLPAEAENVAISWPSYDAKYGLKVRNPSGTGGLWVSACSTIEWVK